MRVSQIHNHKDHSPTTTSSVKALQVLTLSAHTYLQIFTHTCNCNFFADNSYMHSAFKLMGKRSMMEFAKCVIFLHYISDEKIKTTRDQVTTQINIPVPNFVLLNGVDSLIFQF